MFHSHTCSDLQGSGGLAALAAQEADGDVDGDAGAGEGNAEDVGEGEEALQAGSRQARKARSRYRSTGAVGDASANGPPGGSDEVITLTCLQQHLSCLAVFAM